MRYFLYILSFNLLVIPLLAGAQLTSENFQVDGFSVGSDLSATADSANFSVSQESGGLFESDAGVAIGEGTKSIGGYVSNNEDEDVAESEESTDSIFSLKAVLDRISELINPVVEYEKTDETKAGPGNGVLDGVENTDVSTENTTGLSAGDPEGITRTRTEALGVEWFLELWWLIPLLFLLLILRSLSRRT